jgi:hypothetical protein
MQNPERRIAAIGVALLVTASVALATTSTVSTVAGATNGFNVRGVNYYPAEYPTASMLYYWDTPDNYHSHPAKFYVQRDLQELQSIGVNRLRILLWDRCHICFAWPDPQDWLIDNLLDFMSLAQAHGMTVEIALDPEVDSEYENGSTGNDGGVLPPAWVYEEYQQWAGEIISKTKSHPAVALYDFNNELNIWFDKAYSLLNENHPDGWQAMWPWFCSAAGTVGKTLSVAVNTSPDGVGNLSNLTRLQAIAANWNCEPTVYSWHLYTEDAADMAYYLDEASRRLGGKLQAISELGESTCGCFDIWLGYYHPHDFLGNGNNTSAERAGNQREWYSNFFSLTRQHGVTEVAFWMYYDSVDRNNDYERYLGIKDEFGYVKRDTSPNTGAADVIAQAYGGIPPVGCFHVYLPIVVQNQ